MGLADFIPVVGGVLDYFSDQSAAEKNAQTQREFAQNGVQWKVEDAKKAGINPIYALGASTMSFSPSYVGSNGSFARAGQDVSRAMQATATAPQRAAVDALSLERAGLENELLRAQILKTKSSIGPPMPTAEGNPWLIPGQAPVGPNFAPAGNFGGGGLVEDQPLKRTASAPGNPSMEAGAIPDLGFARTGRNGYAPVPGNEIANRIEDNMIASITWAIRNQLLPALGVNRNPPPVDAGKGQVWGFNPFTFSYEPTKARTGYTVGGKRWRIAQ